MTNKKLTHEQKLMFAEVTTSVSSLVVNKMEELRIEYQAKALTPGQMSQSLLILTESTKSLLSNFSDRFRTDGRDELADVVESWSDAFEARENKMRQKMSMDDILGALKAGLGVAETVGENKNVLEAVGSKLGDGGAKLFRGVSEIAGKTLKIESAAEFLNDLFEDDKKAAAGITFNFIVTAAAEGVIGSVVGVAALPVVLSLAVGAVVGMAGAGAESLFDEFATMFGWEDPKDAAEVVRKALEVGDDAVLAHLGDHLFWGLDIGDDYTGTPDERNDMVGAAGNDTLTGGSKRDYLNGGADNDDLAGKGGDDKLFGGDGDDTLAGGTGNDTLQGGGGQDHYVFTTDDLTQAVSTDVVHDSDGSGSIVIDGVDAGSMSLSEYVNGDSGVTAWQADDYKYLFTYSSADHTLIITLRKNGSRIVVRDWANGDLGIDLPQLEQTHPPQSAPLTTGDDLFGHGGNNTGKNQITALSGNDGISAGAGDDFIDGGDGNDLIYGGSGDDTLSGGWGVDIITDDAETMDMEDWSDDVGNDGKTQRQREQARMQQLGSAVVAKGKGWYVYVTEDGDNTIYHTVSANGTQMLDPNQTPSGNDSISGGVGNDVIWSGEGSDTVQGGKDDDYIDGGADDDQLFGGDGADQIWGDAPVDLVADNDPTTVVSSRANRNGNDAIFGGAGSDTISGAGGNDLIDGGDGGDLLWGNGNDPGMIDHDAPDADYISGGMGTDTIFGGDGDDTIRAGDDEDVIHGDDNDASTRDGDDLLYGEAGNDTVYGGGGDDSLHGGVGADSLLGDSPDIDGSRHGRDVLYGGEGNDSMAGGGGDDVLDGGAGDDLINGDNAASLLDAEFHGSDYLDGGAGNDSLFGNGGDDSILGGEGEDVVRGGEGSDLLHGGAGNDQVSGDQGDDTLHGDQGNDTMWGKSGDDVLHGEDGDDVLVGDDPDLDPAQAGNDTLYGGSGQDSVYGGSGRDSVYGGDGRDQLSGGDGSDLLHGGAGNDVLDGKADADVLYGDSGADTLFGGVGDDTLSGGVGNDLLVGGEGNDTFLFQKGFGQDDMTWEKGVDAHGQDLVSFGPGISISDAVYTVSGDDLTVKFKSSDDSLVVHDYFHPDAAMNLHFADGGDVTKKSLAQQLGVNGNLVTGSGNNVRGTNSDDRIYGSGGNDVIYALGGEDFVNAGDGDDTIYTGSGSTFVVGGRGNDEYIVGTGFTEIAGLGNPDDGADTIEMGVPESSVINYQISDETLDIFIGTPGSSPLKVVQLDGFLAGTAGHHVVRFANGKEFNASKFKSGSTGWSGTSADDHLTGDDADNDIYGAAGDDTITGGAGSDYIEGNDGHDVLNGGTGDDTLVDTSADMYGGEGNDSYIVNYNEEKSEAFGLPMIHENSDEGTDTVHTNAYSATIPKNVENVVIEPSKWVRVVVDGNGSVLSYKPRTFVGNSLDNVMTVETSGLDVGESIPSQVVYKLDGGAGADTLVGSRYDDIYVVDSPDDVIIEPDDDKNHSFNTVQASYSFHLDTVSSRINKLQLVGSSDLSAWGTDGSDLIDGSMSRGSDTLYGGKGNDKYIVDSNDHVVEAANGGVDTVVFTESQSVDMDMSGLENVENATLGEDLGFPIDSGGNLSGDRNDNVLTGNRRGNVIRGGDGDDTLFGTGSHSAEALTDRDSLYGGKGNDVIHAGRGGARIQGDAGDDLLVGGAGVDNFYYDGGDGADTIQTDFLGPADTIVFGDEIAADDVAYSRDGSALVLQVDSNPSDALRVLDYWSGTSEEDGLTGEIGQLLFTFADGSVHKGNLDQLPLVNDPPAANADSLSFDATVGREVQYQVPADTFVDDPNDDLTLSLEGAPDWLAFDPATGVLTGTPSTDAGQGSFDVVATDSWGQTASISLSVNLYRVINGTAGDDQLSGSHAHDEISGLSGNDVLDDAGHVDRLLGGKGDDQYLVEKSATTITERPDAGFDIVKANSDYTLSDNVEKLILVEGSDAERGTGNGGKNTLVGNSANNMLDGGAGADTLVGGDGDDTYVVDNTGDNVVEQAGEGIETVQSSIDYTLGGTLENLTLLGSADLNGAGNDKANVLLGNAGDNRLEGGSGADTMSGGQGDDYYIVASADDRVHEGVDEGNDTVERRYDTNLVLADQVENLVLADGVQAGNGNTLDNTVTGNAQDNTLGGQAGADTLHGLAGDDALFGGDGNDRVYGGVGNDYLDGGTGTDMLTGGTGDDTYIVDSADEVVVEQASEGTDAVQATSSYTLSDHVENMFLMANAGAIDGTGNAQDNYMSGNEADNVLNGRGGNDTLVAGKGHNVLIGGTGDDKYVIDTHSQGNVIDNGDGGFDGVFFSDDITRDRLSFSRDGDDLLIFVDDATDPAARVQNHFQGGDAAIDYVQPDGGNYLTATEINQIVAGGATGGEYDQVVEGTGGGEQLTGSVGNDLVKGLGGDDQLFGMAGDDKLLGGDGDDYLAGGNGSGTGSGDDDLEGGAGGDTLAGEDGSNLLNGGIGDDKYIYGGGQDTVDNTGGGNDGVFFNNGISVDDLVFTRDGDDLVILVSGDQAETVRVTNHFLGGDDAIDYVQPASGSMLDTDAINALVGTGGSGTGDGGDPGGGDNPPPGTGDDDDYGNVVEGTSAGEQLLGTSGRDLVHGQGGNDTAFGFGGDDKLTGGDGDDYLSGGNGSFNGSGNDILVGNAGIDTLVGEDGNDSLIGGAGGDKYIWQAGSDFDVIDNTGGGTDWLFFNGVGRNRLQFHRDGDDLVIMVDGDSGQGTRVVDHFLGGDMAIDYIQPADGNAIAASQIDGLLTPMPEPAVQNVQPQMVMSATSVALPGTTGNVTSPSGAAPLSWQSWGQEAGVSSWRNDRMTSQESTSVRLQETDSGHATLDLHRMIEAMASFSPASGATLDSRDMGGLAKGGLAGSAPISHDMQWERQSDHRLSV